MDLNGLSLGSNDLPNAMKTEMKMCSFLEFFDPGPIPTE